MNIRQEFEAYRSTVAEGRSALAKGKQELKGPLGNVYRRLFPIGLSSELMGLALYVFERLVFGGSPEEIAKLNKTLIHSRLNRNTETPIT